MAVNCVLWSILPAAAQNTFRSDVKLVNILATVRDSKGRIISGLTKDDFVLTEDGRLQEIHDFVGQSKLPLTICLLVDTSGSMLRVLPEERAASATFLKQALRPEIDGASIYRFDTIVDMLSDVQKSHKILHKAVAKIAPSQARVPFRRTTALYDAVVEASQHLRPISGRKAIVILSDGLDAGSQHSKNDAVEAALRSDLLVYAILIPNRFPDMPVIQRMHASGRLTLEGLVSRTGGSQFETDDKHSFGSIYEKISEELRNQYRIGLVLDEQGGAPGFHSLSLTTKTPGLTVQSRKSFYIGEVEANAPVTNVRAGQASISDSILPHPSGQEQTGEISNPALYKARDLVMKQQGLFPRFVAQERAQCFNLDAQFDRICDVSAEIVVDHSTRMVQRRTESSAGGRLRIIGSTSLGEFGSELSNIFRVLDPAQFHAAGENGGLEEYDFFAGWDVTSWQIWDGEKWLAIPYLGALWIDTKTNQMVRLQRTATGVLGADSADLIRSVIDFAPANIGGVQVLGLPVHTKEQICSQGGAVCQEISSEITGYSL